MNDDKAYFNIHIVFIVTNAATFLAFLSLFIHKSVGCKKVISSISSTINKILIHQTDKELRETVRTFSQQTSQHQRSIRSEFFEVDWTLLQQVKNILKY
jgi:hypothetical protein